MLGKESFSGNDGPDAADTWGFSHRHSALRLYGATLQGTHQLWGGLAHRTGPESYALLAARKLMSAA